MFNAPIEGLEIESYAQPDILAMYPQYTQNQNCAIAVCKRKQLTFLNARVGQSFAFATLPNSKTSEDGNFTASLSL